MVPLKSIIFADNGQGVRLQKVWLQHGIAVNLENPFRSYQSEGEVISHGQNPMGLVIDGNN